MTDGFILLTQISVVGLVFILVTWWVEEHLP